MSIRIMSQVMRDATYDGKQKLVLLAIADAVDNNGVGFASYRQIKQITDVTDEYLRRSIRRFVDDGRLAIVRKGSGPGSATIYRVILPDSVGENSVGESYELPNSEDVNSPTESASTPQLGVVQLPNSVPYSSLDTPPLEAPPLDAPSQRASALEHFDSFWFAYPRRQGKGAAKAAWKRATKKATPDHIIEAAGRYRDDPNREDDFTALPSTWLNQERWDDDPLPKRSSGTRAEARTQQTRNLLTWAASQDDRALEVQA